MQSPCVTRLVRHWLLWLSLLSVIATGMRKAYSVSVITANECLEATAAECHADGYILIWSYFRNLVIYEEISLLLVFRRQWSMRDI